MSDDNALPVYGFYSQEAAENECNVAIWEDENGNEVKVTIAASDITGSGYHWQDAKFIGKLKKFLRVEQLHPEFVKNFLNEDQI